MIRPFSIRRATRTTLQVASICGALVAAPGLARAQFSPGSIGVTGGLAVPLGQFGDNVKAGYSVGGLFDFHPAPGPLFVRFEIGYDRFETKESVLSGIDDPNGYAVSANAHFLRGTGNVVFRLPSSGGLRPYLTGGVGIYQLGSGVRLSSGNTTITRNDASTTKLGFNGGVGLELPLSGISTFVEARAHNVRTDGTPTTYVPITVGIRF